MPKSHPCDFTDSERTVLLSFFSCSSSQIGRWFPGPRAFLFFILSWFYVFPAVTTHAADTTITSGQTVGQQTLNDGDRLTVDQGGTVAVTGITGAVIDAVNNTTMTVINNGTISTDTGSAVDFTSSNFTGINTGTITGVTAGIEAQNILSLTNSGTIIATVEDGLQVSGTLGLLVNTGSITGNQEGVDMDFGTIINSGFIQGDIGIEADRSTAGNASVTNSGIIQSDNGTAGTAIDFLGTGNDSLIVSGKSIIIGAINLGAGTDTFAVKPGHSSLLTFDAAPEVIDPSESGPVFTSGAQVAALDPTALSLADDSLADITQSVGGIVSQQASRHFVPGQLARSKAQQARKILLASTEPVALPSPDEKHYRSWIEGFGGYNDRGSDGPTLGAETYFAGGVVGIDRLTMNDTRMGLFFGGSVTDIDVDFNSQDLDVDSIYGGVYVARHFGKYMLDSSLTVGGLNFDNNRAIANNTVAGGVENAQSDYSGIFFTPQVTLARPLANSFGISIVPSLRLGYTGLFIESYQETGSTSNLSVDDRDLHILHSRAQIAFNLNDPSEEDRSWDWGVFAGLDGRISLGDDSLQATLLGQTVTFDPGGDDEVLKGFAGLNMACALTDVFTIKGSAELGGGTDNSFYTTGRIRAILRF